MDFLALAVITQSVAILLIFFTRDNLRKRHRAAKKKLNQVARSRERLIHNGTNALLGDESAKIAFEKECQLVKQK